MPSDHRAPQQREVACGFRAAVPIGRRARHVAGRSTGDLDLRP